MAVLADFSALSKASLAVHAPMATSTPRAPSMLLERLVGAHTGTFHHRQLHRFLPVNLPDRCHARRCAKVYNGVCFYYMYLFLLICNMS